MRDRRDEGLWGWKQTENNRRMIELQDRGDLPRGDGPVELAYFGGSAFRITSPAGLTIMIDPWRNLPVGSPDWFLHDFPDVEVDIGLSTHSHFDHDALHLLRASMLIDRPVGRFAFADVEILGVADKHVSDSRLCDVDWVRDTRLATGVETNPPNNCRSFDNCIVIIETGGLRILHWGDNRPDPPDAVWNALGSVDVALLPIDGSQHVLGFGQADRVGERLGAKVIVPHHYYVEGVTTRESTLRTPTAWLDARTNVRRLTNGAVILTKQDIAASMGQILWFGDHVAVTP